MKRATPSDDDGAARSFFSNASFRTATNMHKVVDNDLPKADAISETAYYDALVAGLARVAGKLGRGNLSDKAQWKSRNLNNLFAGITSDTKGGKALIDFLMADITALDEVLALYGLGIHRLETSDADDFSMIADTASLQAVHTDAMREGGRDHRATLRIADKARPVVAGYNSIIAQADKLRGAA